VIVSWQSYERTLPDHVRFYDTWGNKPGLGTYWKRKMHKARRRYWREMIDRGFWLDHIEPHPRRGLHYESMVSWRTW
jgi:hypothetical protein